MQRFMTMKTGTDILVFSDDEDAINAVNTLVWDEYVWQFAETRYAAIRQHDNKHDEWSADSNADRPLKNTY